MQGLLRPMMIMLLAAFVTGMFTHAVAASSMALEMAAVHDQAMEAGDCDGCDDTAMQQGDPACELACDMVFVATLPDVAQLVHPQYADPKDVQQETLNGWMPPLGRTPPRSTFLS